MTTPWYLLPSFLAPMRHRSWNFNPDEPKATAARAIWLEAKRQQEEAYANDRLAASERRQDMTDEERRAEQNRKKKQRKERAAAERAARQTRALRRQAEGGLADGDDGEASDDDEPEKKRDAGPTREIWALPISVDLPTRQEFVKWYTHVRNQVGGTRQVLRTQFALAKDFPFENTYAWPRPARPRTEKGSVGFLMQNGVYTMHCEI